MPCASVRAPGEQTSEAILELLSIAVASLLGPFLKELASAGSEAVEEAAKSTGNALGGYAARLWKRLFERRDHTMRPVPEAGNAGQGVNAEPTPHLVEAVKLAMQSLSPTELSEIEQILRSAEKHGGPRLDGRDFSQSVIGVGNNVIGQNQGNISIGGR
jgi:hypothetical protein